MEEKETTVLGCPMKFSCSKKWENLEPSPDPKIRFCHECRENVHFCATQKALDEAREKSLCVSYLIDSEKTKLENRIVLGMPEPILLKGNPPSSYKTGNLGLYELYLESLKKKS